MNKIKFSFAVISLLYQSENTKKTEVYTAIYDFSPEDFTMESLIQLNDELLATEGYISNKRPSLISVVTGITEDNGLSHSVTFEAERSKSLNDTKTLLGHPVKLDTLKTDCMRIVEYVIKNKTIVKETEDDT